MLHQVANKQQRKAVLRIRYLPPSRLATDSTDPQRSTNAFSRQAKHGGYSGNLGSYGSYRLKRKAQDKHFIGNNLYFHIEK
ncbi:hypothetical protein EVA_01830 [gut metagenome]|uniref:Uncharacterized protein n=1 Tax=gut metagenome TaxID=749906 RepID=J9H2I1_9ZZZZ